MLTNKGLIVSLLNNVTGRVYYGFTVALEVPSIKSSAKNIYHTLSEEVNF